MGPKWIKTLLLVSEVEGQAEAYPVPNNVASDFDAGFVNRVLASRMVIAGYLQPFDYQAGEPLRLTDMGREFIARVR